MTEIVQHGAEDAELRRHLPGPRRRKPDQLDVLRSTEAKNSLLATPRHRPSRSPDRLGHGPAESLGTIGGVKFREVIRLLEDDGWRLVAQRGSHQQYEHPNKPGKVTVAGKPGADVPKGTAANILRQAGLRRPGR